MKKFITILLNLFRAAKNQDANTTVTVLPAALKKMKLPLTVLLFINSGL